MSNGDLWIKTNADLCKYMNMFMEKRLPDKQERKRVRAKYFALYIFLLSKAFQFKMDFCKELIHIFCENFVYYAKTGNTPDDVFSDITHTIVAFDRAYCAGLTSVKRGTETARTQNAYQAVAGEMLTLTKQADTPEHQKRVMDHIAMFLEHIAAIIRLMQPEAPTGAQEELAAENMRASQSSPEKSQ
ncbi:MAG TPA: hypothetical protein DEB31_10780 [Clostridiales bacterium]|nr:hypothetical protein [Clostridiales bacterium]